jgi:hypothetical protein
MCLPSLCIAMKRGTLLPNCYLGTIRGYICRPTHIRPQQFFYCCVYSLKRESVWRAYAILTKFLKIYTKHRHRQPLPVIHKIDFAIHNGSVVGIVTSILTFSIVRNGLKMAIEWAETCRDCNKNVINILYSCSEWRFYFNRFAYSKGVFIYFLRYSPTGYTNQELRLKYTRRSGKRNRLLSVDTARTA